jgi:hypothetical protein
MPINPHDPTIPPSFPDSLTGVIYWPRAMGRPRTHHLADGFSVFILGTISVPAGPDITFELEEPIWPKLVDEDGGPDHWRVGFTHLKPRSVAGLLKSAFTAPSPERRAQIERESTYTVKVFRLADVEWDPPLPAAIFPARVTPREFTFTKYDEGTYAIPDFGMTDRF